MSELEPEIEAELDPELEAQLQADLEEQPEDSAGLARTLQRLDQAAFRAWESARPVLVRLDKAAYDGLQSARGVMGGQAPRRLAFTGIAVALLAIGGFVAWHWTRTVEPMTRSQLTRSGESSRIRTAGISPDGTTLAYADAGGLHLLDLESSRASSVVSLAGLGVEQLDWSPDGTRIYLVGRGKPEAASILWSVELGDPTPRQLRVGGHSPAVSPDGTTLAFVETSAERSSIWLLDLESQESRSLAEDKRYDHTHPFWLTNERLAFVRETPDHGDSDIVSRGLRDAQATRVVENFDPRTPPCWSPDGRMVFGRTDRHGASIWSVPVDPESGEATDEETRILQEAGVSYYSKLSVDASAQRLGFVPVRQQVDAYVAELETGDGPLDPERLRAGEGDHWPVAWRDEGSALLIRLKRRGESSFLTQRLDGAGPQSEASGVLLAQAPDGSILYAAPDGGGLMRAPSAAGEPERLGQARVPMDSRRPVVRCPLRSERDCVLAAEIDRVLHLFLFDPRTASGQGRELARVGLNGRDYGWNLSPDGGRVAVVNGGRFIKLVNLHNGAIREVKIRPSFYSQGVAWSASGRELYLSGMLLHSGGGHVLYRVQLDGRTELLWKTADRWFGEPLPSPDGKRLALAARTVESDAFMLEHF